MSLASILAQDDAFGNWTGVTFFDYTVDSRPAISFVSRFKYVADAGGNGTCIPVQLKGDTSGYISANFTDLGHCGFGTGTGSVGGTTTDLCPRQTSLAPGGWGAIVTTLNSGWTEMRQYFRPYGRLGMDNFNDMSADTAYVANLTICYLGYNGRWGHSHCDNKKIADIGVYDGVLSSSDIRDYLAFKSTAGQLAASGDRVLVATLNSDMTATSSRGALTANPGANIVFDSTDDPLIDSTFIPAWPIVQAARRGRQNSILTSVTPAEFTEFTIPSGLFADNGFVDNDEVILLAATPFNGGSTGTTFRLCPRTGATFATGTEILDAEQNREPPTSSIAGACAAAGVLAKFTYTAGDSLYWGASSSAFPIYLKADSALVFKFDPRYMRWVSDTDIVAVPTDTFRTTSDCKTYLIPNTLGYRVLYRAGWDVSTASVDINTRIQDLTNTVTLVDNQTQTEDPTERYSIFDWFDVAGGREIQMQYFAGSGTHYCSAQAMLIIDLDAVPSDHNSWGGTGTTADTWEDTRLVAEGYRGVPVTDSAVVLSRYHRDGWATTDDIAITTALDGESLVHETNDTRYGMFTTNSIDKTQCHQVNGGGVVGDFTPHLRPRLRYNNTPDTVALGVGVFGLHTSRVDFGNRVTEAYVSTVGLTFDYFVSLDATDIPADQRLANIRFSLALIDGTTPEVRLGLYTGGTSDTLVLGATLLHDLGEFRASGTGEVIVPIPDRIDLPTTGRLWIAIRGASGSSINTGTAGYPARDTKGCVWTDTGGAGSPSTAWESSRTANGTSTTKTLDIGFQYEPKPPYDIISYGEADPRLGTTSITIGASGNDRMLIVIVLESRSSPQYWEGTTFDGSASPNAAVVDKDDFPNVPTQAIDVRYWLDTDLPSGAGSYDLIPQRVTSGAQIHYIYAEGLAQQAPTNIKNTEELESFYKNQIPFNFDTTPIRNSLRVFATKSVGGTNATLAGAAVRVDDNVISLNDGVAFSTQNDAAAILWSSGATGHDQTGTSIEFEAASAPVGPGITDVTDGTDRIFSVGQTLIQVIGSGFNT